MTNAKKVCDRRPEATLLSNIILQAIRDVESTSNCNGMHNVHRKTALDFLTGKTGVLKHICKMLSLNYVNIINHYSKLNKEV
jgi:hypothetical protein